MKKLLSLLIIPLLMGCSEDIRDSNDLEASGLKGSVKEVKLSTISDFEDINAESSKDDLSSTQEFNEKGFLIKDASYWDGEKQFETKFEYDGSEYLTKVLLTDESGEVVSECAYEFDAGKNESFGKFIKSGNDKLGHEIIKYNEVGLQKEVKRIDEDGNVSILFQYEYNDDNQEVKTMISQYKDGKRSSWWEITSEFDDSGNLIKSIISKEYKDIEDIDPRDPIWPTEDIYKNYKFDDSGNWIYREVYSEGKLGSKSYREISYY